MTESLAASFLQQAVELHQQGRLEPAQALYRKFGFDSCEPFGDYVASPHNVFMTRAL